jgi:hypothetical protein
MKATHIRQALNKINQVKYNLNPVYTQLEQLEFKAEEFDNLRSTLEDAIKLYRELCEKTEKETLILEYRLLENFIVYMPNTYRKRNCNWVVVKDFLQFGTSRGGRTSSIEKCLLLGIDPDSYTLKQKEVEQ